MATCVIAENPNMNAAKFEEVLQHLRGGDFPPDGLIFQVAGQAENGWRVITIWKSREAYENFASGRLVQTWAEVGVSRDDITFTIFETHTMVAGDLSAVPQPAMTGSQT